MTEEAIHERFPQKPLTTQNYCDLFELDLDAVVIATPLYTHHAIARHFLECIAEGGQPQSDSYSGARVVQILEAAQRSLDDSGRLIKIAGNGYAAQEAALKLEEVGGLGGQAYL